MIYDLPFFDRHEEMRRLHRLYQQKQGRLAVIYGRRRCGKSRLILESVASTSLVYYFGDERESSVQRSGLAAEIAGLLPGFDQVRYPDWDSLLVRWFRDAPPGSVLALDELPSLVASAPELPSLIQKHLERRPLPTSHLVLCGSSQRMMQGLALDQTSPLYERAREILGISPLPAGWLQEAFPTLSPSQLVETYAVWGGVPRYWELARQFSNLQEAITDLVLSPFGVLHDEPATLLQDDLKDTVQSASLLHLIGQGCQRLSELAGRLEKPPTNINRPIQRLVELELIFREKPFGSLEKDSKRSYYRILDPFLSFWYRCVGPQRSRLQARQFELAQAAIERDFPHHVAGIWEDLVRSSVPHLTLGGKTWGPAQRWWGPGLDRKSLEIDVVAESLDESSILLGSCKWQERGGESAWTELRRQAEAFPHSRGRKLELAVFCKHPNAKINAEIGPEQVLQALR